ncbi:MAG: NADH-quinone oxidoreductase subunit D [Anaerolineae bacterium]|nr:NADH-quinone oxidoreductase subunit D [Anaerolineae bacterium]
MTQQVLAKQVQEVFARFSDGVVEDQRVGYQGYIVAPEHLLDFARALRDECGYDYLTTVTGVDYLADGKMEVVYHAFKTLGGPALEFKVQTNRQNPIVPSLALIYPSAELQEREIWDLFGIRFEGHPDLRRILLWEGFYGHPLRKDWKEPYFEEVAKPFKSRFPDGKVYRAEDKHPLKDNIDFPEGFDPAKWEAEGDAALYKALTNIPGADEPGIKTEQIILNFGPQHPSTHGVFRMAVLLDGETIVNLKHVLGYLHRNHEKIGERNTYIQNMPFTDRLDYITSMSNNFGYAVAVEKLMGIQPPERAEYLRVMMAEFTRVISHLMSIGFLLNDLGAFFTPMMYALEEREMILDVFEAVSGSRMMCNYFRFGGVAHDVPDYIFDKIKGLVFERLPRRVDEIDAYLTKNEIIRARCEGVGVLTPEQAIALGVSGPLLRGSGVPYDIRRAEPYSIYDRLDFDVVFTEHGDVYDRYLVRLEEIRQSIRILQQVVKQMPEGPIQIGKSTYQVKVPPGEAYGRVEAPKGELGFYLVSDGKPNPYRYHVRSPSFVNLGALAPMSIGSKVADAVVNLGSIDIVLGEVDR